MTDFREAKGLSTNVYAMSIAATWVWAPAIFVASSIACQYGIEGFLWFFIPNVLTLILFGFVAKAASRFGPTASDTVSENPDQEKLHKVISLLLLVCSTFVQLLGVWYLASAWFNAPRWLCAALVLLAALALVWRGGLRSCILTDVIKYALMVGIGCVLLNGSHGEALFSPEYDSLELALSFGIPTTIGLLAAPYVDSTFWQRAYSLNRGDEVKAFSKAALFFAAVPLVYGGIGLFQPEGWSIQTAFENPASRVLLAIAVLSALVSTIDSSLCAVGAYFKTKTAVVVFSLAVLLTFIVFDKLTIVDMFLFYGTVRTVAAVPTVLTVFKKVDPKRLFRATLTAALVCPVGFALCKFCGLGEWAVVFTALAVVIPLLGWKK